MPLGEPGTVDPALYAKEPGRSLILPAHQIIGRQPLVPGVDTAVACEPTAASIGHGLVAPGEH